MIMTLDVDVTAERRHYNTHRPLKGKRLTTFCASLALLYPLLSLTHWIFRSLMLPYKSSSHIANHVRCASLRSGGRRLAVRTAMEHLIGALPRTPFPASRDFAPVGSMSLDFQVASLSYKSSSFATSRGNERYEGRNSESYTSGTISAFSPFGALRHHLPPRSSVGRQNESALMGRLGALLRPTWRSYAGPPQWDYGCLAMEPCLCRKA